MPACRVPSAVNTPARPSAFLKSCLVLAFESAAAFASQCPPASGGKTVRVAVFRNFYIECDQSGFGFHGIVEKQGAKDVLYTVPQSTPEDFRNVQKKKGLSYTGSAPMTQIEWIGAYQLEGNRLWFGKTYYDGEGSTGVGAFGYFDFATRKYQLFSPKEVAPYEVSALLVQPDAIWLGLDIFGEDISTTPVGLARWDRQTHQAVFYPLEFSVQKIAPAQEPDLLRLTTLEGYALFRSGKTNRFRVVQSADGKRRTLRVKQFPPPPTHY